jgi:hypothetical protein
MQQSMAEKRKAEQPPVLATAYFDAEGNRTEDPAQAVRGEVLEQDADGRRKRRTWFFLEEVEIKWLPVSETAFLLWVLFALLVIWVLIGVALGLFW